MTKEEREVMQMALGFVASISPAFICEATHHKKNERHADNEPCPHVAKQKATYEAIEKCLANEALEKKAENARELGLDYKPVAFASHGVVNWIADKQFQHEADLYATPQRTWVGLTQEELSEIYNRTEWNTVTGWEYERAIEAKLKAKNGFHSTEKNT